MGIKSLVRLGQSPEAVAKLQAYVKMTDAERSAEYAKAIEAGGVKVQRDTVRGYLIPFALGASNKIIVPCRFLKGATGGQVGSLATEVKSMTVGYVFDTPPDGFEEPNFANAFKRPARVSLKLASGATEQRTSRITGRKYSAKQTDSISQSFGAKAATPDDGTLGDFNDIAAKAKTWAAGGENRSYKMTPEGGR
jgi:hypothetical protein